MSESIMDQIVETPAMSGNAKILVVGVGGGGCNAVQNMIDIIRKGRNPLIPLIVYFLQSSVFSFYYIYYIVSLFGYSSFNFLLINDMMFIIRFI